MLKKEERRDPGVIFVPGMIVRMSKICISCGAINSDKAIACNRCGIALPQSPEDWEIKKKKKKSKKKKKKGEEGKNGKYALILLVAVIVVGISAYCLKDGHLPHGGLGTPKLSENEAEEVLTDVLSSEKRILEGIYESYEEREPVNVELVGIEQDGDTAVVDYRLVAAYRYADCEVIYHCDLVYISGTEKWKQGPSEIEVHWNYHDIEGVWEYRIIGSSDISRITVEKESDGYRFTYQYIIRNGSFKKVKEEKQCKIRMEDIENEIYSDDRNDRVSLFDGNHYFLSAEEGIEQFEKVE